LSLVSFCVARVGPASDIDSKMLSDLFGVHVHQVTGYPGTTEKRIAIERGELDGDCLGWTSIPENDARDNLITVQLRYSRRTIFGLPESAPLARDVLTDETKRQILDLVTSPV